MQGHAGQKINSEIELRPDLWERIQVDVEYSPVGEDASFESVNKNEIRKPKNVETYVS